MAKAPPKPFFPLKHEYSDSLDAYSAAAMNLYNAVDALCAVADFPGKDTLKEKIEAFRKAAYGDTL